MLMLITPPMLPRHDEEPMPAPLRRRRRLSIFRYADAAFSAAARHDDDISLTLLFAADTMLPLGTVCYADMPMLLITRLRCYSTGNTVHAAVAMPLYYAITLYASPCFQRGFLRYADSVTITYYEYNTHGSHYITIYYCYEYFATPRPVPRHITMPPRHCRAPLPRRRPPLRLFRRNAECHAMPASYAAATPS